MFYNFCCRIKLTIVTITFRKIIFEYQRLPAIYAEGYDIGYVIIVFIYILAYHFYNQNNRGLEKNEERELNGHKLIYKEMERKISIKYFLQQTTNV